jgi:phosphoribosylamine--glycine ligase
MPRKLKVLVIGGGGREHALVWKLAQSPLAGSIFCAPGNAGISQLATCVPLKADDLDGIVSFARQESMDLAYCGPEIPLVAGLTDRLIAEGIPTYGPSAAAAMLEGSKAWARRIMEKAKLPIPAFAAFDDADAAKRYVLENPGPCFVKADGLAAGKGAVDCANADEAIRAIQEMMEDRVFGESGARLVIEERMVGEEFSAMAFLQGEVIHPMVVSQDHKRALDGDEGLNTGGMGAYTPVQSVTPEIERTVTESILRPLIATLAEEGIPYHGVIYPGLMITESGVKIVEFNCRFGDPETEVILPLMDFDLLEVFHAGAHGKLTQDASLPWKPGACACVVMASGGYPGPYESGQPISGLDAAAEVPNSVVFHAGTKLGPNGETLTAGGRVLAVTAWGDDGQSAIARAYETVGRIDWDGAFCRKDIGHRLLAE